MAHSSLFTTILFRLLNFAILLGFFFYLFKKYGLKNLKEGLEEHHATIARLNETLRIQKRKANHTYRAYNEREKLFDVIKNRVERWAINRNRLQEKQLFERKNTITAMQNRAQQFSYQQTYIRNQKLYAPQVLARTQQILTQRYSDEKIGKEFIQQCLNKISKSIS